MRFKAFNDDHSLIIYAHQINHAQTGVVSEEERRPSPVFNLQLWMMIRLDISEYNLLLLHLSHLSQLHEFKRVLKASEFGA
jgi:hypothetical protein